MPESKNWYRNIIDILVEKYKHFESDIINAKADKNAPAENRPLCQDDL